MLQVVGFVEQYATAPKTARRRLPGNLVSFQSSWRRRSIGLRPNRLPDVANSMAAIIPPDACGWILSKSDDGTARRRENGGSGVETSCGAIGPSRPIIGVDGGPGLLPSMSPRSVRHHPKDGRTDRYVDISRERPASEPKMPKRN